MAAKTCGTCAHFDPEAKDEAGVALKCTKKKLNVGKDSAACEEYAKAGS